MHEAIWWWERAGNVAIFATVAAVIDDLGDIAIDGPADHEIVDMSGCDPGDHEESKYVVADDAEIQVFETFGYLCTLLERIIANLAQGFEMGTYCKHHI